MIIQNTNTYEVGFTTAWDGFRNAFWKNRTEVTEKPLIAFLQLEAIKQIYLHGHRNPDLISPDNWNMDFRFVERPTARQIQMDLFYDYRTNVTLYPQWQKFLREHQPEALIFWGQNDIFFTREGGEAYLKDLPNAKIYRLDSGHFAVEDCLNEIGHNIRQFYFEKVSQEIFLTITMNSIVRYGYQIGFYYIVKITYWEFTIQIESIVCLTIRLLAKF